VRFFERIDVPTVVLVGPADHVIDTDLFMAKARVAFTDLVGPLVVPGAGHFLQWEQAGVLNGVVAAFLRDRLPASR
jgi:pimeloyl-ACP methyl ester carboxylesterase